MKHILTTCTNITGDLNPPEGLCLSTRSTVPGTNAAFTILPEYIQEVLQANDNLSDNSKTTHSANGDVQYHVMYYYVNSILKL